MRLFYYKVFQGKEGGIKSSPGRDFHHADTALKTSVPKAMVLLERRQKHGVNKSKSGELILKKASQSSSNE
ncbi:hypothetical protein GCM10011405_38880 [Rufibacter glacialis]|nr:hypothetical protein GCM10011405_38880 [Rufibacter glacialis]